MKQALKREIDSLELGEELQYPLTRMKSMSTTRQRLQSDGEKKFSIKKRIVVRREK